MITKTYNCNLCGDKFDKDKLLEVFWKSDIIPQRYILQPIGWTDNCDKHICKYCIKIIKEYKPLSDF